MHATLRSAALLGAEAPPVEVQVDLSLGRSLRSGCSPGALEPHAARLTGLIYLGKVARMKIATSRISPQGQISVPAEVRALLGVAPGATLEWDADDGVVRVRRAGRFSSLDIHRAAFGAKPPRRKSVEEMDAAITARMRAKHARR